MTALLPSLSPLLALCICNFWLTKIKQFLFVNLPKKKKNFFQVAFSSVLYYFAAATAAVVCVLFFSKTFIRKTKRTKKQTNKQRKHVTRSCFVNTFWTFCQSCVFCSFHFTYLCAVRCSKKLSKNQKLKNKNQNRKQNANKLQQFCALFFLNITGQKTNLLNMKMIWYVDKSFCTFNWIKSSSHVEWV